MASSVGVRGGTTGASVWSTAALSRSRSAWWSILPFGVSGKASSTVTRLGTM